VKKERLRTTPETICEQNTAAAIPAAMGAASVLLLLAALEPALELAAAQGACAVSPANKL
jgi:hypothetical protein